MLIFDESSRPIIIDNLSGPIATDHFWVLDLNMLDFTLAPLTMIEEITGPCLTLFARGFEFKVPAHWFILVYDRETTQLDAVQVSDLAGKQFTAAGGGPNKSTVIPVDVTAVDYDSDAVHVGPALNKHQMVCHPISSDLWITLAATDVYNKFLKNKELGDIF